MKTQKVKFIFIAVGAVFFTSCSNLLYTTLDVLRPAKVVFAPEANNLLIVNNTVNQPSNFGHKNTLLNTSPQNIKIPTDSLSIFCLGALTEDLDGKDFFSSIDLIPATINHNNNFFKSGELDQDSVKSLCSSHRTNVILSLDKIKVNDNLSEFYLPGNSSFYTTLELQFETTWSIHYPDKPNITPIQFNDTIIWDSESYYRKKAMSDMPNRTNALIDGALNVGHKSVNRFVPYWEKVDRYFFNTSNKYMKQAMDSVYVKNWKSAITLWGKTLDNSSSPKLKAQASNNIAIGYEITGEIDKALEYATRSYYLFGQMTILDYNSLLYMQDYMNELNQRKNEIVILKEQLGE